MKRFFHLLAVLSIASLAAEWVTKKFVIKATPEDPDGFILQTEGFGMDDGAIMLTFGVITAVAMHFFGPH